MFYLRFVVTYIAIMVSTFSLIFLPDANATITLLKNLPNTPTPKIETSFRPEIEGNFPVPPLQLMGSYGYEVTDFAAQGDYAYAIEGNRVRVLSYIDPANVTVVSEILNSRPFTSIKVSLDGTRLFVLAGNYYGDYAGNELLYYDVSDPTQPRFISVLRAPFQKMYLDEDRLYLSRRDPDAMPLQVYSWEGDTLTLLGQIDTFPSWGRVLIDDGVLVVATYSGDNGHESILLYDVSDDFAPEFKRSIMTIGGIAFPLNGYLYVSNGGYLDIWDVRDIDHPQIIQTLLGTSIRPFVTRGNLVLARGNRFYDLTNPTEPLLVGEMEGVNFSDEIVWTEKGDIYTSQSAYPITTLQRLRLTDTYQVIPQGSYVPPWQHAAVPVTERYLYLFGTTPRGIDIYDMQEPEQPRLVANVLSDLFVWPPTRDYHIVDQRLYMLRSGILTVLDVSEPLAPVRVSWLSLGNDWLLESVQNGYLYALRNNSNEILVLRLSDLAEQRIELPNAGQCSGLDTEGTMLVLTCDTLRVYDITDPTHPTLVGSLETPLTLLQPTLSLPYLFVTTRSQLAIYDLSTPEMPLYITSVANPTSPGMGANDVSASSPMALVCPELTPVQPGYFLRQCHGEGYPVPQYGDTDIVDLRIPTAPRRSESVYAPTARGVVQGDTLIVADEEFSVWRISPFLERSVFIPFVLIQ